MPAKNTKTTDVTTPGKVAPSASSRPIIVTNRPVITTDPMMVGESRPAPAEPALQVHRADKVIAPVLADSPDGGDGPTASAESSPATSKASVPEPAAAADKSETKPGDASEATVAVTDTVTEAAAERALAAETARAEELEKLIASGTYVVPINAVGRKRSRMFVAAMCVFAVLLALLLFDAVLDVGLLKLSFVPHTHLFSGK